MGSVWALPFHGRRCAITGAKCGSSRLFRARVLHSACPLIRKWRSVKLMPHIRPCTGLAGSFNGVALPVEAMRICKRMFVRILLSGAALLVIWEGLLAFPQPLFKFSVRAQNLVMYSDRPFSRAAGEHVLEIVQERLAVSPLYSGRPHYRVFICNSRWRQILFFNKDYGTGGVAQYPLTSQVFLREAAVEDNRLISPGGKPVKGDRTLDYFVAHELTHQLTGAEIGPLRFYRLPQWVREGYADYIGKGRAFRYSEARRAFLAGDPEMDQKRSGLYTRFHLFVAHLLDHQHWSVERLLKTPPAEASVADAIRGEQP